MKKLFIISLTALTLTQLKAQDSQPPVPEAPADAVVEDTPPEAPAEEEAVIPTAFDTSRYQSTWEKNPFLLKTAPVVQAQVAWSQDYALAGMFNHKGKIRVSIKNKQTNEYKHISSDASADAEFRLVRANFNRNRSEASAVIAKGTEEAELKYDEANATQAVTINNTMRPAGGAPAAAPGGAVNGMQPSAAPGRPNIPQPINKPNLPGANIRTANSGVVPGGVATTMPGAVNNGAVINQPGTPVNTANPGNPANPNYTPPVISRRRQLIPAPVVPTQP